MTLYLRRGTSYHPTDESALDVRKELPPGNYIVEKDLDTGQLYFESTDPFYVSGKIYGDTEKQRDRIFNTFQDRTAATGVLLNGEKGSGKTLLAKMLSLKGIAYGYPTITINQPWCGEQFNKLIQSIEQPAIVMFDEFEKVYDDEHQPLMLTLLDGVFPTKKLFVLTCNDKWRIDSHMRNRPGRIFYLLDFDGLDSKFITEYCNENLNDTSHTETVCRIASLFHKFNFDVLKALCEEMNRYNESPQDAMKMLNAKPFSDNDSAYDVILSIKGKAIPPEKMNPETFNTNPIGQESIEIRYYGDASVNAASPSLSAFDDYDKPDYITGRSNWTLQPGDLKAIDSVNNIYTYVSGDIKVVFTKRKEVNFRYMDML